MSSAQLDPRHELQHEEHEGDDAFALTEYPALKQEVAARLAAHRARRQRSAPAAPAPIPIVTSPARARAAKIAAAVAERYANSESYREFLAAEAETAIRQAEAAAEVAAVTARAVAEAQLNLLEELDQYKQDATEVETGAPQPKLTVAAPPAPLKVTSSFREASLPLNLEPREDRSGSQPARDAGTRQATAPQMTVRLYEDVAPALPQAFKTSHVYASVDPLDEEGIALDDEIAFRQAPKFLESTPPVEIPANLIEFPRQLVAARRARPRLAEGPLREDADQETDSAQLRIFEVEPEQISAAPAAASAAPEWSSILLSAQPVIAPTMVEAEEPATLKAALTPVLLTAPLELRIMAAAVDTAIVLGAMLVFTALAALTVGTIPAPHLVVPASLVALKQLAADVLPVVLTTAFTFLFFTTIYQYLFFTFSDATPGMRYARIGLCTFSDENPSRAQMRRRIPAALLAACPLGLGLIWSWIDTDRIGWHDRISRTYQRSY